jgi:aldehyde:ferredoxin oxidoreductase
MLKTPNRKHKSIQAMSPFGYHRKILKIDLSRGNIQVTPLKPSLVEEYLGGRALATRLFLEEIQPQCDPLSPDNVIVFATSPLIGTKAPTACRGHMVFKSPLTGFIGSSNCGGTWAHAFKNSGYDVLIIKGCSPEPTVIDIQSGTVKIVAGNHLWGLEVPETTDLLTESSRPGQKSHVLCIGPAGENLVRFSAVMNDKNRAYGRAGPGAVFGSKKLKAIIVSGKNKITIKEKERFRSGVDQALYLMRSTPITKRLLKELGTSGLLKLINVIEMLPHKNFQDNSHQDEDLDKISGETLHKSILEKAGACYGCLIACQRFTRTDNKKGEGPEYETVVMMGPDCGIYDLRSITLANYRCNELGMDTISFGGTVACAMELCEKNIISAKETGGIPLEFGNRHILEKMADWIAYRKGIGDKLAEGSFRLAETYNQSEFSMSIKKMEIPAYDPRASFTQALGYMTSPTGACHLRGGYAVSLAFFGGTKEIPRFSLLQSPIAIRNMQNLGIIQDSLGICRFTGFAFSTEPWSRIASGITGMDFSAARLEKMANRVAALERIFNMEAGLVSEDDSLPKRFQNEPLLVGGKNRTIPLELIEKMKSEYYQARGWDEQGKPHQNFYKTLNIKGI